MASVIDALFQIYVLSSLVGTADALLDLLSVFNAPSVLWWLGLKKFLLFSDSSKMLIEIRLAHAASYEGRYFKNLASLSWNFKTWKAISLTVGFWS